MSHESISPNAEYAHLFSIGGRCAMRCTPNKCMRHPDTLAESNLPPHVLPFFLTSFALSQLFICPINSTN